MLSWVGTFLVIAVFTALIGFGTSGAVAAASKVLFVISFIAVIVFAAGAYVQSRRGRHAM